MSRNVTKEYEHLAKIFSSTLCAKSTDGRKEEVANAIDCSAEFYSRLERGYGLPSTPMFVRLANVFGVSADELLSPVTNDDPADMSKAELVESLKNADPDVIRAVSQILRLVKAKEGQNDNKE